VVWIVGVLLSALWFHSWIVEPPSRGAPPSYLLGLGGPILILGACAFLSMPKRGKKP